MREIEFRGKRIDNNECSEWIYGDLTRYSKSFSYITVNVVENEVYPVLTGTVEQYTGLKDKNGVKIYENDILKYIDFRNEESIIQVWWDEEDSCFNFGNRNLSMIRNKIEVIGNIYENPELLEGGLIYG